MLSGREQDERARTHAHTNHYFETIHALCRLSTATAIPARPSCETTTMTASGYSFAFLADPLRLFSRATGNSAG